MGERDKREGSGREGREANVVTIIMSVEIIV